MPTSSKQRILVTGACGTIGAELVKHILDDPDTAEVVCIDNNESELFFLEQRFSAHTNASFLLADIQSAPRVEDLTRGIDAIFHAAAFKHVILCERSPQEAVQNNIVGVQNIIRAARKNGVGKIIFTSSDKAVNPTSVMGTSKLMGERLITAANSTARSGDPIFSSTRFGNVLGSRGSVVPIFHRQIAKGGPVTITDTSMTRFIMSIGQAVKLVVDSARIACGGEVFITKMPVIRIMDLAEVMIEELAPRYGYDPKDVQTTVIGSKPGEKLYEELMSEEERPRSVELGRYFAVLPAFKALYRSIAYEYADTVSERIETPYNSANETPLGKRELRAFLLEHDLLEESTCYMPGERYWPDPADKGGR